MVVVTGKGKSDFHCNSGSDGRWQRWCQGGSIRGSKPDVGNIGWQRQSMAASKVTATAIARCASNNNSEWVCFDDGGSNGGDNGQQQQWWQHQWWQQRATAIGHVTSCNNGSCLDGIGSSNGCRDGGSNGGSDLQISHSHQKIIYHAHSRKAVDWVTHKKIMTI